MRQSRFRDRFMLQALVSGCLLALLAGCGGDKPESWATETKPESAEPLVVGTATPQPVVATPPAESKRTASASILELMDTKLGQEVVPVFPTQNPPKLRDAESWMQGVESLKARIVRIDCDSTIAATRALIETAEKNPDGWVAAVWGYTASPADAVLNEALLALSRFDRAFPVRHDKGRALFLTKAGWLGDGTTATRVADMIEQLRLLEKQADSAVTTVRVDLTLAKLERLRHLHRGTGVPPDARKEMASAEDYLLANDPSPLNRADILLARRQWEQALQEAAKGISEQPWYARGYIQSAEAREALYNATGDAKHLDLGLKMADDARSAGVDLPSWAINHLFARLQSAKEVAPLLSSLYEAAKNNDMDKFSQLEAEYLKSPRHGWWRYQAIKAKMP